MSSPQNAGCTARSTYHTIIKVTQGLLIAVAIAGFLCLFTRVIYDPRGPNPLPWLLGGVLALLAVAALGWASDVPAKALVGLFCPACGKYLPVADPWQCATCDHPHREGPSFLDECSRCQVEPKAYACYHCGAVIPLTEKVEDIRHVATRLPDGAVVVAPLKPLWASQEDDREREKARLADDIEIAKLQKTLENLTAPQRDSRTTRIAEMLRVPLEGREIRDALRNLRKSERKNIRKLGLSSEEEQAELDALDRDIDTAMGNSYCMK